MYTREREKLTFVTFEPFPDDIDDAHKKNTIVSPQLTSSLLEGSSGGKNL